MFYLIWGHRTIIIKHHILKRHILALPNISAVMPSPPAQSNYRHIFLGPALPPIRKSGFWEQPRLIRPRLYASEYYIYSRNIIINIELFFILTKVCINSFIQ